MSELLGVNEQEVTEPVETQEGVEEQEVTEPVQTEEEETSELNQDNSTEDGRQNNAAFAEMRRKLEAAEQRSQELENEKLARDREMQIEEALLVAEEAGVDLDDFLEIYEAEEESSRIKSENEAYKRKEQLMDSIAEVLEIDPEINSLEDLGESFFDYIEKGLTGKQAYYASKAEKSDNEILGAKAPGKVNKAPIERDYYTSEELDAMSDEELEKNWAKVQRSMGKL